MGTIISHLDLLSGENFLKFFSASDAKKISDRFQHSKKLIGYYCMINQSDSRI